MVSHNFGEFYCNEFTICLTLYTIVTIPISLFLVNTPESIQTAINDLNFD